MSEKTQYPTVIKFVKLKSWFIPYDAECYRTLVSIKVPMVKIHADFLPTLQLATKPRNIRATSVPFSEIFNEKMDQVGGVWLSKADRRCSINETRATFQCKASDKNRKAISSLDTFFAGFCARWGLRYTPIFSETASQLKLVVDYQFDPELNPCIPSVIPEENVKHELVLGFTKICLTFKQKGNNRVPYNHLQIFTKSGVEWLSVHTGSFSNKEIGDPSAWLAALGTLYSQFKIEDR
jgi:hypothetical protein